MEGHFSDTDLTGMDVTDRTILNRLTRWPRLTVSPPVNLTPGGAQGAIRPGAIILTNLEPPPPWSGANPDTAGGWAYIVWRAVFGNSTDTSEYKLFYSKNGGNTWTDENLAVTFQVGQDSSLTQFMDVLRTSPFPYSNAGIIRHTTDPTDTTASGEFTIPVGAWMDTETFGGDLNSGATGYDGDVFEWRVAVTGNVFVDFDLFAAQDSVGGRIRPVDIFVPFIGSLSGIGATDDTGYNEADPSPQFVGITLPVMARILDRPHHSDLSVPTYFSEVHGFGPGLSGVPYTTRIVFAPDGASGYTTSYSGISDINGGIDLLGPFFGNKAGLYTWRVCAQFTGDPFAMGQTGGETLCADFHIYVDGQDIPALTWRMWTPSSYVFPGATVQVVLADADSGAVWRWDPDAPDAGAWKQYVWPSVVEQGKGYWVKTKSAARIRSSGEQPIGDGSSAYVFGAGMDTASVMLRPGWNQIGSGQWFHVDWSKVRLDTGFVKYSPAEADTLGLIYDTLYWYNGSSYNWGPSAAYPAPQMKPSEGYWLEVKAACTMTVYPKPAWPDTSVTSVTQAASYKAPPGVGGGNDLSVPPTPPESVRVITPTACIISRFLPSCGLGGVRFLRDAALCNPFGRKCVKLYYSLSRL